MGQKASVASLGSHFVAHVQADRVDNCNYYRWNPSCLKWLHSALLVVKGSCGSIVNPQLTLSESFQFTFYCLNHVKLSERRIQHTELLLSDQVVMSSTPAMLAGVEAAVRNRVDIELRKLQLSGSLLR